VKSHFADEERLREIERDFGERRENSGKKLGTNTYLWSLTSRTKRDFGEKRKLPFPRPLSRFKSLYYFLEKFCGDGGSWTLVWRNN